MSAYTASPETLVNLAWYTNSGASHHCIPFAENLLTKIDYGGKGKVIIDNGKGLSISSIGSTTFVANRHTFHLPNMLHILEITKNLISVLKFCQDNHVFFEFHHNLCFVKNLATRRILLYGVLKDGLYTLSLSSLYAQTEIRATIVFGFTSLQLNNVEFDSCSMDNTLVHNAELVCDTNSYNKVAEVALHFVHAHIVYLETWHKRLGHPSSRIV